MIRPNVVGQIRAMHKAGYSAASIARELGIAAQTARKYCDVSVPVREPLHSKKPSDRLMLPPDMRFLEDNRESVITLFRRNDYNAVEAARMIKCLYNRSIHPRTLLSYVEGEEVRAAASGRSLYVNV